MRRVLGDKHNILVSGDPINDLLAVSSYSLLVAELDGMNMAEVVVKSWNKYLGACDIQEEQRLINLLGIFTKRGDLRPAPRELIRIGWKQKWERLLAQRGFDDDYDPQPQRRHPSAIVRLFAIRHAFDHPEHLFLTTHIYSRPNAKTLKVPREVEELRETLRRMTSNDTNHHGDDDERS